MICTYCLEFSFCPVLLFATNAISFKLLRQPGSSSEESDEEVKACPENEKFDFSRALARISGNATQIGAPSR